MSSVADNLAVIRGRIEAACEKAGRDSSRIQLVGVTKTVPIERIREGVNAGISILGENYVQEARKKKEILADLPVAWHFIGHLQTNKAGIAVECCDCIETLDRENLALELNRKGEKAGKRIPVLIQINIGSEPTKSGIPPERLFSFFNLASNFEWLNIRGLMALPPFFDQPERARPYFRQMRELLDRLRQEASFPEKLTELSMGMSGDFEVAIEEGATLVRIGTALFGQRPT
jgi:hypothetical protein